MLIEWYNDINAYHLHSFFTRFYTTSRFLFPSKLTSLQYIFNNLPPERYMGMYYRQVLLQRTSCYCLHVKKEENSWIILWKEKVKRSKRECRRWDGFCWCKSLLSLWRDLGFLCEHPGESLKGFELRNGMLLLPFVDDHSGYCDHSGQGPIVTIQERDDHAGSTMVMVDMVTIEFGDPLWGQATGFPNGSDVTHERVDELNSEIWGLNNWKNRHCIVWDEEG